jgi:hypothetical protein
MNAIMYLKLAVAPILFGVFLWASAVPASAACVTNANGDTFCYEELPPMPAPELELLKIDLPPPPGYEWECTSGKNGTKTCTQIAIKEEGVNRTPLQGTTVPLPKCGSGDPLKGLGIPSGGPKTPCPTSN